MPNPNPSPETRFKPGQSGNPAGGKPGKRPSTVLLELIAEKGAERPIAIKWLERILAGDFRYMQEYLNRTEGKVPDRLAGPQGESLGTILVIPDNGRTTPEPEAPEDPSPE